MKGGQGGRREEGRKEKKLEGKKGKEKKQKSLTGPLAMSPFLNVNLVSLEP